MSVMDDEQEKRKQIKETLVHSKMVGMSHPSAEEIIKKMENHVEEINAAQEAKSKEIPTSGQKRPYQETNEQNITTIDNKKPNRDSGGRQYGS